MTAVDTMLKNIANILENFFTPTAKNASVPYALSRISFLFLAAFGVLLVMSPLYFPNSPLASLANFVTPFKEQDVIGLVNASRDELRIRPLTENKALTDAAVAKATDMFARQYFSHVSPDNKEPWTLLFEQRYEYAAAGENLAIDFTNAREAHAALMNSASHRANILNTTYREIGVAVESGIFNGRPTIIIVQFFGAPRPTFFENVFGKGTPATPPPELIHKAAAEAVAGAGVSQPHVLTFERLAETVARSFTTNLTRGSRGSEVEKLQTLLARDPTLYPEQIVTGYFGLLTENAVKRFQTVYGIVAFGTPETTGFGMVGPKTRSKLTEVFDRGQQRFTVLGEMVNAEMRARSLHARLPWSETVKILAALVVLCLIIATTLMMTGRRHLTLEVALRTVLLVAFFLYIGWVAASSELLASRITELPATTTVADLE